MRADFLSEVWWLQSVESACSMLYLELKTNILPPLEGNDKRDKINSNNNRLKRPIYQLHFSCTTFMQSITRVLCVQLCNYSNNLWLMQLFFQNISQCDREKKSLYELPHRHMFYIKLFIYSFLFKISFGANIFFQLTFVVVYKFSWTIRLLVNENWNKKNQ